MPQCMASAEGTPVKNLLEQLGLVRTAGGGVTTVSYGLLVALAAIVVAGTVVALGATLNDKFDRATCGSSHRPQRTPAARPVVPSMV
jgi:Flp pilus assembly pilin Flp